MCLSIIIYKLSQLDAKSVKKVIEIHIIVLDPANAVKFWLKCIMIWTKPKKLFYTYAIWYDAMSQIQARVIV